MSYVISGSRLVLLPLSSITRRVYIGCCQSLQQAWFSAVWTANHFEMLQGGRVQTATATVSCTGLQATGSRCGLWLTHRQHINKVNNCTLLWKSTPHSPSVAALPTAIDCIRMRIALSDIICSLFFTFCLFFLGLCCDFFLSFFLDAVRRKWNCPQSWLRIYPHLSRFSTQSQERLCNEVERQNKSHYRHMRPGAFRYCRSSHYVYSRIQCYGTLSAVTTWLSYL